AVESEVGPERFKRFRFIEGSVSDFELCRQVCQGVDYILHEAGFISVPQSIEDPLWCNRVNVDGTLNMLVAAREAGVQRFVYASSSAVYGDDETIPKVEETIGKPLSPYGNSKLIDEPVSYKHLRAHETGAYL
ncbi:NAD-dependent epimerase/dehydratase family protein, partial [Corallococcus praedator]